MVCHRVPYRDEPTGGPRSCEVLVLFKYQKDGSEDLDLDKVVRNRVISILQCW